MPVSIALSITTAGETAPLASSEGLRSVISAASAGGLLVLLIGITMMAGEFRHNTATTTFLITPVRLADAGACVLVSTHILSDVERIGDRAVVLDRGTKKAEGTLDELRRQAGLPADADLEASFLTLTEDAPA